MVCGRPIFTCVGLGSGFSPAYCQNLNHGGLDMSRTITYRILLPIEYYHPEFLKHVGKKLGKLLKVDAITSAAIRGRYASVCDQINMATRYLNM